MGNDVSRRPSAPETGGDVGEAAVGSDAVQTLVGGAGVERTAFGEIRPGFHVVEYLGSETGGQLGASGVPTGLQRGESATHGSEQPHDGIGIVVAAHEADAGHFAGIVGRECQQSLFGEFIARVFLEIGTVAAGTAVGAKREVDGQCDFIGKFLEYDIVVYVFEHDVCSSVGFLKTFLYGKAGREVAYTSPLFRPLSVVISFV